MRQLRKKHSRADKKKAAFDQDCEEEMKPLQGIKPDIKKYAEQVQYWDEQIKKLKRETK